MQFAISCKCESKRIGRIPRRLTPLGDAEECAARAYFHSLANPPGYFPNRELWRDQAKISPYARVHNLGGSSFFAVYENAHLQMRWLAAFFAPGHVEITDTTLRPARCKKCTRPCLLLKRGCWKFFLMACACVIYHLRTHFQGPSN